MEKEENIERARQLIKEIEAANYMNSAQTSELFSLNNALFPDLKEFSKGCDDCRIRVYKRIKKLVENE